ncbi:MULTISPECIES: hypothetical protein [Sinorhizobium]|uniref:ATP-grasp domain-containing protein n=1 Tax=Sinorhizobium americanum TaxID=194963 RepID=A0A2S3YQH5_9HYPH|nr:MULTISPECIES: hypothetical protein [Sinorhizobium]PDT34693.1 hypothetical protein CO656_27000 [Sinorhizobium sp. FG01]PDT49490.1 hypothetical protein CO664_27465 [Sinorhizobium sp. NG07B]POH33323.1 hypothetical protein ATY30_02585 [Sinorhizobium americanum]POH33497.1 hypothetical protein ATY31_10370 [Sinorhizobium americanum]
MLRDISVVAFRTCECRDYARVDVRVDRNGQPFVLEINADPGIGVRTSYGLAATTAGHNFSSLVNRILDVAHLRHFGTGLPKV